MKFTGSHEDLNATLARAGISGEWREPGGGQHQFKTESGGLLNWWPSTGTLNCQGPAEARSALETALADALTQGSTGKKESPNGLRQKTRIFVVHGHDQSAREQLELVLHKLGLEPFVLQNTSGNGLTIIEALERQIGHRPEAEFGIVLITPDDMGYAKRDGEKEAKPRARQNVILEMGMLLASLTRERVAILVKGFVDPPSDAAGIIYLHFNDHVKEVVPKLAERLQGCGIQLDAKQISRAAS